MAKDVKHRLEMIEILLQSLESRLKKLLGYEYYEEIESKIQGYRKEMITFVWDRVEKDS